MIRDENRRLDATLYTKEGKAEVVLTRSNRGERVGSRCFKTVGEALDWLKAMKWDYKVAV